MMPKKGFIRLTFISAAIAAVICGSLCASVSFAVKKTAAEHRACARAARLQEIKRQLALIEDRLAELQRDLFEAETRLRTDRLVKAEPGLAKPRAEKNKAQHPSGDADYSYVIGRQGLLLREMDQLQEELLQTHLPGWGWRQFISSFLAGTAIGFAGVWLAARFARLRIINWKQKVVIAVALAVVTALTVYPPWVIRLGPRGARETVIKKDAGHSFVWKPAYKPPYMSRGTLDLGRLFFQWVLVVGIAIGLFAAYADTANRQDGQNHLALTKS
ncbi:MAG: hypothetical protein ACYTEQ_10045 [Planctomycetota bacterium]|jgi:hypothetical protein